LQRYQWRRRRSKMYRQCRRCRLRLEIRLPSLLGQLRMPWRYCSQDMWWWRQFKRRERWNTRLLWRKWLCWKCHMLKWCTLG
jgi:hypothetical protein